MDVDLDDAWIGGHLEDLEPVVDRRQVALDHDRLLKVLRRVLDDPDQLQVVFQTRQRRHEDVQPPLPGLDAHRRRDDPQGCQRRLLATSRREDFLRSLPVPPCGPRHRGRSRVWPVIAGLIVLVENPPLRAAADLLVAGKRVVVGKGIDRVDRSAHRPVRRPEANRAATAGRSANPPAGGTAAPSGRARGRSSTADWACHHAFVSGRA